MFRVHLFFQYAEKTNPIGVSFFSISGKFRYVRAIWQSLKEILSLENSKFIKGTQSNIRVGAVDLGITLHLGC